VKTYTVEATRVGSVWLVYVPEVDRTTQARSRDEIEPMARDLVAVMRGVSPESVALRGLPSPART